MWNEILNPEIQWMDVCDHSLNEHINVALPSLTFTRKSTHHLLVWMGINSAWKFVVLWELRDITTKILYLYLWPLCPTQALTVFLSSVLSQIQYFPGRLMVMNLLQSLNSWLQDQSGDEISYEALEKMVDNTAQVSPERVCLTFGVEHIIITHKRARGAERSKASCLLGALGQSKTTSGTRKLSEIRHYIPNTKRSDQSNHWYVVCVVVLEQGPHASSVPPSQIETVT